LGMSRAEIARKLDAIIDFSGLERFLDTPTKKYSSGMLVRLGFSVAVHVDPEALLIDEVLSVGDLDFVLKSYRKIEAIRASGVPVVLVSHNLQQIRNACSRALWLDHGRVRAEGTPNEVIEPYLRETLSDPSRGPVDPGDVQRVHADGALSITSVDT